MALCDCDDTRLGNFGQPDCITKVSYAVKYIFGKGILSTGVRNSINSATLTSAAFADRFNRWAAAGTVVSDDNRLWMTPLIEVIKDERSEPEYKTYESGRKIFTKDGDRDVEFIMPEAAYEVMAEAYKYCCQDVCYWVVDANDNLIGKYYLGGTSTLLYGELIEPGSFYPSLMKPKAGEPMAVKVAFRVERLEQDADIRVIPADKFTAGYSLKRVKEQYNITGTAVSCSQTVLVIKIYAGSATGKGYNSFTIGQGVKGLVVGDFKVWNITDQVELTPSGIVEDSTSVEGESKYTITVASQGLTEDLRVRVKKSRYDSYYLEQVVNTVA